MLTLSGDGLKHHFLAANAEENLFNFNQEFLQDKKDVHHVNLILFIHLDNLTSNMLMCSFKRQELVDYGSTVVTKHGLGTDKDRVR